MVTFRNSYYLKQYSEIMQTSLMIFHILRVMLHKLHVPVTDERLRNLIKEQIHRGSLKTLIRIFI